MKSTRSPSRHSLRLWSATYFVSYPVCGRGGNWREVCPHCPKRQTPSLREHPPRSRSDGATGCDTVVTEWLRCSQNWAGPFGYGSLHPSASPNSLSDANTNGVSVCFCSQTLCPTTRNPPSSSNTTTLVWKSYKRCIRHRTDINQYHPLKSKASK